MKKELLKTVVMSNTLTQNAVANFSRIEYLIFLYAVSKVEINDVDFGKITVPIANFCDLFGLKNYDSVRNAVKRLWQERILLNNKKLRVMSACGTNEKNEITIKLHKDLSDYLIGFDKNYTIFNLGYLVGLKSKYSIRLYLLCCSVKNQHIYSNTYTSINLLLNGKYRNPSDIERRILSPADNEINWYSDLYISIKNYNNRLYIFSRLRYATRRTFVAGLTFEHKSNHVAIDTSIEQKFIEISNRQASFNNMSIDEKLAEIANLIENMLKKNGSFITPDYSSICFDYVSNEAVANYRKKLHAFRHATVEAISERKSFNEEQKKFLVDYGLTIINAIHALTK